MALCRRHARKGLKTGTSPRWSGRVKINISSSRAKVSRRVAMAMCRHLKTLHTFDQHEGSRGRWVHKHWVNASNISPLQSPHTTHTTCSCALIDHILICAAPLSPALVPFRCKVPLESSPNSSLPSTTCHASRPPLRYPRRAVPPSLSPHLVPLLRKVPLGVVLEKQPP